MAQKNLLQSAGDGTAVPSGYVGEVITGTSQAGTAASSGVNLDTATLTLTPGTWHVVGSGLISQGGGGSTTSGTAWLIVAGVAGTIYGRNVNSIAVSGGTNVNGNLPWMQDIVYVPSGTKTVTIRSNIVFSGTVNIYSDLVAVRIA